LLPTRRRVRGDVELAPLVPAGEAPQLGGRTDIRAAREESIERDISVIEGLEAGFQVVFFENLALGRDDERRERGVDAGGGRNLLESCIACGRGCQYADACAAAQAEETVGHALRLHAGVHGCCLPGNSRPTSFRGCCGGQPGLSMQFACHGLPRPNVSELSPLLIREQSRAATGGTHTFCPKPNCTAGILPLKGGRPPPLARSLSLLRSIWGHA